ncbi:DedA family protein [Paenibacillus sp. CAA11]|uniref:DedA family protein n=1 Tax=Paenibacillus sp. CAA11 TaxID=1532905 RepID=UPI001F3EE711|nr:hypothetical protein [Paenibacillus sp. CAA11]
MDILTNLLEHYGYSLIFLFLCFEMLALPLPGEMMMSYIGLSVYEQKLSWFISIVSAGAGVLTGVTLSYWIGYRLGRPFVDRYGKRVHLTEERMDKMALWFEKYRQAAFRSLFHSGRPAYYRLFLWRNSYTV